MPSLHKRPTSDCWYCAYYLPDGRRALRSTGQTKKPKAMEVCLKYAEASRLAKTQRMTEFRAREVIGDIYAIANQDRLPSSSVRDYLASWLSKKELELADSSFPEYKRVTEGFIRHLGAKADRPVDAVTVKEVTEYRGALAKLVSGGTVNKNMKLLRGAWTQAVRDGLARENIFMRVSMVKAQKAERRAFTLPELTGILNACTPEWRGVVIAGIYTGQRLSDIANLTWQQVDLEQNQIAFTTRKTGRRMVIPIAAPLQNYLVSASAPDDPKAPVFPSLCGRPVNTLSHQFRDIMALAGLASPTSHQKRGRKDKKDKRRIVSEISFHALRHTATSLLKNAGVSDVVAREIIGHDSDAVSRVYTHIETNTLRQAVERLPDITVPRSASHPKHPIESPAPSPKEGAMTASKQLAALAKAVRVTGDKPTHKTLPASALARLKRAAANTTVAEDKAAQRARRNRCP